MLFSCKPVPKFSLYGVLRTRRDSFTLLFNGWESIQIVHTSSRWLFVSITCTILYARVCAKLTHCSFMLMYPCMESSSCLPYTWRTTFTRNAVQNTLDLIHVRPFYDLHDPLFWGGMCVWNVALMFKVKQLVECSYWDLWYKVTPTTSVGLPPWRM